MDLAGFAAAANPVGRSLSGVPAKVLTRGYHLSNVPSNKLRIAGTGVLRTNSTSRQRLRLRRCIYSRCLGGAMMTLNLDLA